MPAKGWIGVDLDGTLAEYHGFDKKNPTKIGPPIPRMVKRVKAWLRQGKKVKIFTARVDGGIGSSNVPAWKSAHKHYKNPDIIRTAIQDWCEQNLGQRLEVTNVKDALMIVLWDDRARQVEKNTGRLMTAAMLQAHLVKAHAQRLRQFRTISQRGKGA